MFNPWIIVLLLIVLLSGGPGFRAVVPAQTPDTTVVRLQELIEEARLHNPELMAARARTDASRFRVPPAGALPNPMLMYELNNIGLTGFSIGKMDMSATGFSFTQAIPYPGKRGLRTGVAESDVRVYEKRVDAIERDIIADVKIAYYDLYLMDRSLEIIDHNEAILRSFTRTASARYEVGEGSTQDILRSQVEISRLKERRRMIEQRRRMAESRINRLLSRPADQPVGHPEKGTRAGLTYTQEELFALMEKQAPVMQSWDRLIERQQIEVSLARKEVYPDFTFGAGWMTRGGLPDMYQFRLGVELPLYSGRKERRMVDERRAMVAEAESERESARRMLMAEIRDQYTMAQTADELADLYERVIIPQAQASLESAVAGYSVGAVDFLTLLDNLIGLLEDELRYHENVVEHQKALVRLEPLTGLSLIE